MAQNRSTTPIDDATQVSLRELGARLARERLRRNLTQESLAERAGVSRTTVRRLEAGHSTQLANLIRILRALHLARNLHALVPEPILRPMEQLERGDRRRRRASSPRARAGSPRTWTWGDER